MGSVPEGTKTPWYLARWFVATASGVGVVLVLLLVAPYLLDLDRYRADVIALLKRETGREVAIDKLRLHFVPLRVEVENFRVRNPEGFPKGDTFAVRRIGVGLAWRPLLNRQVVIDSLTFDDIALNLLANDAGQTNYDLFDPSTSAQGGPSTVAGSTFARHGPSTLARDGERKSNHERETNRRDGERESNRELQQKPKRSSRGSAEKPLATLTQIDEIALYNVQASAGTYVRRNRKVYPAWRLSGVSAEARKFNFTRPDWLKRVEAEVPLGKVEFAVPSLKEPIRLTKGRLLVKNYAADGEVELAVGKLRASGRLRIPDLSKPVADFQLRAEELNVTEMSALLAAHPAAPPSMTRSRGPRSGGPIRTGLLAKGVIEVKSVHFPPLAAGNFRAALRLYSTRLEIDPITLALYGGTYKGATRIDLAQEAKPATLSLALENVDVGRVSAAASADGKSALTGTFEGKLDLRLNLSASEPANTLAGEGAFAVRNGTFPGLNIRGALAGLANILQLQVPKDDTRFSFFGGDLRIAGERVHSESLKLEAEGLQAEVKGSLGFDKTLDYAGWGLVRGEGQQHATGTTTAPPPQEKNPLRALRQSLRDAVSQRVGPVEAVRVPFRVRGTTDKPDFGLTGTPQVIRPQQQPAEQPTSEQKKKKLFGIF